MTNGCLSRDSNSLIVAKNLRHLQFTKINNVRIYRVVDIEMFSK